MYISLGLATAFVGWFLCGWQSLEAGGMLLLVLGGGFAFFSAYFFRDPERALPTDGMKIYSPGDGVVMSVGREGPGEIVTLRIFLSVFDVHVQRAPCAGVVEWVHYHQGTFRAAMKDEARQNERSVMRIKPEGGREPLVVEQIAGLIARRIECWAKEGDVLKAGQRYGIIHFGSQAAVHFPASARCTVKPGDRVAGALSVIGEWTN